MAALDEAPCGLGLHSPGAAGGKLVGDPVVAGVVFVIAADRGVGLMAAVVGPAVHRSDVVASVVDADDGGQGHVRSRCRGICRGR